MACLLSYVSPFLQPTPGPPQPTPGPPDPCTASNAAAGAASTSARQRYEALGRKRSLWESWKDEFQWLENKDGILFCTVCKEFPALVDTSIIYNPFHSSPFYVNGRIVSLPK